RSGHGRRSRRARQRRGGCVGARPLPPFQLRLGGGSPPQPGAGAGGAGTAATHRSHQPMQSPRGADFRGGGLDQPLQQVLAGAIRHARGHVGGGLSTAATQAGRGEAQNQDRPQGLIAVDVVGRRFAMRYQDTSERLVQYRQQISDLRGKIRELQESVEPQPVMDYTLATRDGPVRLSQLFGDQASLVVVDNMGASCSYCTIWADGFNGLLPHMENRAAFVVASPDDPQAQEKFKASRGWRFRMVSHRDSTFAADMGYRRDDGWLPGVSVF